MAASSTFDILIAARELEAVGVERLQTDAIAGTVRQATADREALTKADLAGLETQLRNTLATNTAPASLRAEIGTLRWAVGLLAAVMFAVGLRVFGLI